MNHWMLRRVIVPLLKLRYYYADMVIIISGACALWSLPLQFLTNVVGFIACKFYLWKMENQRRRWHWWELIVPIILIEYTREPDFFSLLQSRTLATKIALIITIMMRVSAALGTRPINTEVHEPEDNLPNSEVIRPVTPSQTIQIFPSESSSSKSVQKVILVEKETRDTSNGYLSHLTGAILRSRCKDGSWQEDADVYVKMEAGMEKIKTRVQEKYLSNCKLYLSLFHADYEFTRDTLVRSWIAAKLLDSEKNKVMGEIELWCKELEIPNEEIKKWCSNELQDVETTALWCFNELRTSRLIIEYGLDILSDQSLYKLGNDDFKVPNGDLGKGYSKGLDFEADAVHLEHLSLMNQEMGKSHCEYLGKCSNLKTLLLHRCGGSDMEKLLDGLFKKFKLLTILDLSCTNIKELPSSVGNLVNLKCLDMSNSLVQRLSGTTENLEKLEILILLGCKRLTGLPRGISKLTKLRHLALDVTHLLKFMPLGMGKLTKLQILKAFVVGKREGNRIEELRYMDDLKGSLRILKLENIRSEEEAEKACLAKKKCLTELEYRWSQAKDVAVTTEEKILEKLQPHFGLQQIKIVFYSGKKVPSWICDPRFTQMVSMTLSGCKTCESLPSLGELPSLKFLFIIEMEKVVNIDASFCRIGNKKQPAFPHLENLLFEGMTKLQKWTAVEGWDFPHLKKLLTRYCPELVSIPPLLHQKLEIIDCAKLKDDCQLPL